MNKMVFPQLKAYRGRWTKNFSRYWAGYQDRYVTNDPARVFHSFRDSFDDALRQAGVPKEYIKALVGRAREREEENDVTDKYRDPDKIKLLRAQIQKVEYPGIVFERLDAFLLLWICPFALSGTSGPPSP